MLYSDVQEINGKNVFRHVYTLFLFVGCVHGHLFLCVWMLEGERGRVKEYFSFKFFYYITKFLLVGRLLFV